MDTSTMTKEQIEAVKERAYGDLVQNILANSYSINDQIAILKHSLMNGTDSEEFKNFVSAGETAKKAAKEIVDKEYKTSE